MQDGGDQAQREQKHIRIEKNLVQLEREINKLEVLINEIQGINEPHPDIAGDKRPDSSLAEMLETLADKLNKDSERLSIIHKDIHGLLF